jgi:hypothetical protein
MNARRPSRRPTLPLIVGSLLLPSVVFAQQQPWQQPWPFPGLPNPFLPAAAASGAPAPSPSVPAPSSAATGTPVVLELFTSEDCAACESAEYTVNRLVSQPVAGAQLIPLAFHVEFYGGTSGSDPFILPAATSRQNTYDSARGRVYTPQAIVDGDREFVGSEDGTARSAIASAARQPKVLVELSRSPRFVGPQALAVSIRYGASSRRATLTAVLAESGLVETHHGGHTDYDRTPLVPVVRAIQDVGTASARGGTAEVTLSIPPAAVRANVSAVVLLADAASHHVLGAATLPAGIL